MTRHSEIWSLILAAGHGSRLQSLTTTASGHCVPKQYCSLTGGASLLHETIRRALSFSSPLHVCAVVAEYHRQWWQQALWPIRDTNIVVQPQNRGTANGILLPLLHILDQDPEAEIVILPSDHHLQDEKSLREGIESALDAIRLYPDKIMLLGMVPEEADVEFGYVVPDLRTRLRPQPVLRFVEKPPLHEAERLIHAGALWNSFIMVARGKTLLQLMIDTHQAAALRMQIAMMREPKEPGAIASLYATLRDVDFSRHILPGMESRLRLVQVRPCGWSDLGTPQRVSQVLQKTLHTQPRKQWAQSDSASLNLALQSQRMLASPRENVTHSLMMTH